MTPKNVLNKYIKGDIHRDYTEEDLNCDTLYLSSALKAMEEYGKQQWNEAIQLAAENSIKMDAAVYLFDIQQSILKLLK